MTYPGVRRAAKRTELDRVQWAERTPSMVEYDFIAPGTLITAALPFKEIYDGYPDFAYGVELIEGQVLVDGDFPMVNAGVAIWDQTFPETGALPRVKGAALFLVVLCSSPYQVRFRFQFNGVAFANPNLLNTVVPTV